LGGSRRIPHNTITINGFSKGKEEFLTPPIPVLTDFSPALRAKYKPMNRILITPLLFCLAAASASGGVVYNNGPYDLTDGANISGTVSGDSFTLGSSSMLNGVTFWATGSPQTGFLSAFSGSVSWAIYSSHSVSGASVPNVLLQSGTDTAPVVTDTGVAQSQLGGAPDNPVYLPVEIYEVDLSLPDIAVTGGTLYWLVLHESSWGSAFDGSAVYWAQTTSTNDLRAKFSFNLATPSSWANVWPSSATPTGTVAFELSGNPPASGVPEPASLQLLVVGFAALVALARIRTIVPRRV
jgi:hypothetical protein